MLRVAAEVSCGAEFRRCRDEPGGHSPSRQRERVGERVLRVAPAVPCGSHPWRRVSPLAWRAGGVTPSPACGRGSGRGCFESLLRWCVAPSVAPDGASRVSARRPSSLSCLPKKGNPKKGTPTVAPRCAGFPAVLAAARWLRNSPFLALRAKRSSNSPRQPRAGRGATFQPLRSSAPQTGTYRSARCASPWGGGVEVNWGLAPSPQPSPAGGRGSWQHRSPEGPVSSFCSCGSCSGPPWGR